MPASEVCSWLLLLESPDRFPWVIPALSFFKCYDHWDQRKCCTIVPFAVDSDQSSCLEWGAQNQKAESHCADMTSGRWQNTPCVCSPSSGLAVPAAWVCWLGLQPVPKCQEIPKVDTNWTEKEWNRYQKEILTLCSAKFVLRALLDQKSAVNFTSSFRFQLVLLVFCVKPLHNCSAEGLSAAVGASVHQAPLHFWFLPPKTHKYLNKR